MGMDAPQTTGVSESPDSQDSLASATTSTASIGASSLVHSDRQLKLLQKIGVEVWRLRAAESANQSISMATPIAKSDSTPAPSPDVVPTADSASSPPTESVVVQPATAPITELPPIAQAVATCEKCALHRTRTNTVFGVGNPQADWFFVGEAPGYNEDLQGEPFVGRAGKLLDLMIAALGMRRAQVFIANIIKCRPPDNRDPLPKEIAQCEPYLHQQLAVVQPKVIVALGRVSAQALLKTEQALGKLRGQTHAYGPTQIPLVVTYHPAYLLRSPGQKAAAWEDLWHAREIARQNN